jgi:hypothetical protein
MGADLSRIRSNPLLDFTGVELKQGAVVLDADFNEFVAAVDRRVRAAASDILGRGTVSSTTPDAFKISAAGSTLQIGKGRLYVDGLLAENHGAVSDDPAKQHFDGLMAEPHFADPTDYTTQPYLPNPPILPRTGRHLMYLDVWDREVTHLERTDLVEVAVGVETSSRRQIVWQVRVLDSDAANAICTSPDDDVAGWSDLIAPSTGRLTTGTFDVAPEDDPCELPPSGGYRGLENQTYRVEIHDPGQPGGGATFKWSRENASVGSRVASMVSANALELQTLGRDDVLRFNTGDWVEIIDDVREFSQRCGEMRRITVNEATRRITFEPALPAEMVPAAFPDSSSPRDRNLRVRRWDQKHKVLRTEATGTSTVFQDLDASATGVINVPAAGTTLLLENGVTVSFSSTGAKGLRPGDYWVFAARTADASVESLVNAPPRGTHHHYARLGMWDVAAGTVTDCRNPWPPDGNGHDCSCTACVTPTSHASGQFTIQDAVNQVSATGGTVCLAPGNYALKEPVRLIKARSVRIHGQGPATSIVAAGGAFAMRNCVAIAIENLSILTLGRQSTISITTVAGLALQRLVIEVVNRAGNVGAAAISLQGVVSAATIRENDIDAPVGILANDPVAVPATEEALPNFLLVAALTIEDNLMRCLHRAIALERNVLHFLSTRIAGNEVFGCDEVAISAPGPGAPGSSLNVSRNSLNITGDGIRCGADGLWIEGNKLFNLAPRPTRRKLTVGIGLVMGRDKTGSDQCQILANQLTGFSRAGILIATPTRELIVKLNIIENCGNGILSTGNADAASVSIENNHLRNIGASREARGSVIAGIGVVRARAATIAGNTIHTVGVRTVRSALCAAILTIGALRVRVSGNDVSDVSPPGDFVGRGAGIMLGAPYSEFEVSHNRVQRDATPSVQSSNGAWHAVIATGINRQNPLSRIGSFATLRVDDSRVLVITPERPYVTTLDGVAVSGAAAAAIEPRGSVLGNALTARGTTSVVEVNSASDCLFNDNRVELRGNQGSPAVMLTSTVAIVNANRVQGGKISIQVAGTKAAAVVGNITSGTIVVPGGLQPPWDGLNLRA